MYIREVLASVHEDIQGNWKYNDFNDAGRLQGSILPHLVTDFKSTKSRGFGIRLNISRLCKKSIQNENKFESFFHLKKYILKVVLMFAKSYDPNIKDIRS